jgi:succinate dehydrogenase / fumarate reductase membrane anchor subunit
MTNDSLRSPLARARGLGSAKEGFHHWWLQRLTALAMIPLTVWFVLQLLTHLAGAERYQVAAWLERPFVALALVALLIATLTHAKLGIQTVLEDYVHSHARKLVLLLLNQFLFIGLAAAGVFAVVKLHFFGI